MNATITLPDNSSVVRKVVSYVPLVSFFGTETLVYTVADAEGNTSTGTLTITVNENLGPVANPDVAAGAVGESQILYRLC